MIEPTVSTTTISESHIPPVVPEPPKKSFTWLLILLLFLLAAAIGFFAWENYWLKQQLAQGLRPSPSPAVSPAANLLASSLPSGSQLSFSGSLQEYLVNNCLPGNPYSLAIANLPVAIDTGVIALGQRPDNIEAFCSSTEPDNLKESYVGVPLQPQGYLNIYDQSSNELGHGGPPNLDQFGKEIYRAANITINAYVGFSEGPSLLGDLGVKIRGQKEFVTQSGQSVFVNLDQTAIPGNDSRLIEYLTPLSRDEGFEKPVIVSSQLNQDEIIERFFTPPLASDSPEFAAVESMKDKLNAITTK